MYSVYANDLCIYNDRYVTEDRKLTNPKLELSDNSAGSFSFTMPKINIGYDYVNLLTTDISVKKEGKEIWYGRAISENMDFYNNRTIECEGALAFLNDTTQPPHEYHDMTVRGFLKALLDIHNEKVSSNRRFEVGVVTVTDPNDSLYRYTNYEKTIECINSKMIERLGGHLQVRRVNGISYIDYLEDYVNTNTQIIEFSKNLLDFTRSWDQTEYATVIVPLGNTLEESPIEALDAKLDVSSVNNGSIYVQNSEAVKNYGWIEKVVTWNDVSVASNLLRKAQEYLSDLQFSNIEIELSAIDLHYLSSIKYEDVKLLDRIRVVSIPHGMDRYFPVKKLSIPLDSPENTTFTLGDSIQETLTDINNKTNSEILQKIENIPSKQTILNQASEDAIANATKIMNLATNGFITVTKDEKGSQELFISDTLDYTKAHRLWRWNINGLGYSKDGGKTYGLAMTMDGSIVADYVNTGKLTANIIKTGILSDIQNNTTFNLTTGELTMTKGSININNGAFEVDNEGNVSMTKGSINIGNGKFKVESTGKIISTYGIIGGFTIGQYKIYNEVIGLTPNGIEITVNHVGDGTIETWDIGKIGVNNHKENNDIKGLTFDLNENGEYMSFASYEGSSYILKLWYGKNGFSGHWDPDSLNLGCTLDGHNNKAKKFYLDDENGSGAWNGITGTLKFLAPITLNGDRIETYKEVTLQIRRGFIVSGSSF